MNRKKLILFLCTIVPFVLFAQDGTILEKKIVLIHDTIWTWFMSRDSVLTQKIKDSVDFYRITYMSDGLKVTGYITEPKKPGKYPCIISNRGGNRDWALQPRWRRQLVQSGAGGGTLSNVCCRPGPPPSQCGVRRNERWSRRRGGLRHPLSFHSCHRRCIRAVYERAPERATVVHGFRSVVYRFRSVVY
jgi:hypothetical protein